MAANLYSRWIDEPAPWTAGYDDGVRVQHTTTLAEGTVIRTRLLGNELIIGVRWDKRAYANGEVDPHFRDQVRIVAGSGSHLGRPTQLALFADGEAL
jgi:hypothetical protein